MQRIPGERDRTLRLMPQGDKHYGHATEGACALCACSVATTTAACPYGHCPAALPLLCANHGRTY